MPFAPVAIDVHQAFDVLVDLFSQITFDDLFGFDVLTDPGGFFRTQILDFLVIINFCDFQNLAGFLSADPENIGQPDFHPLIVGYFNTCYSCQNNLLY